MITGGKPVFDQSRIGWEREPGNEVGLSTQQFIHLQSNAIQDARKQKHSGRERVPYTHPAQA